MILDLLIPELSGTQIVEELRAHSRTQGIPILIHTGVLLEEEQRQTLAAQVQSITFKSEQDLLFAELEKWETAANQSVETEATL
jgi:CheY-like chemotaxis protein